MSELITRLNQPTPSPSINKPFTITFYPIFYYLAGVALASATVFCCSSFQPLMEVVQPTLAQFFSQKRRAQQALTTTLDSSLSQALGSSTFSKRNYCFPLSRFSSSLSSSICVFSSFTSSNEGPNFGTSANALCFTL
jgi:hypothetical protein